MFMQDEEEQRYGLWVAFGAIFIAIALVLGLAISKARKHHKPAGVTTAAKPSLTALAATVAPVVAHAEATAASPSDDIKPIGEPIVKVYFDSGKATLPEDSGKSLSAVVAAATAEAGKKVLISGFHDATGDPVKNAQLAKLRAIAVRDALKSQGIDEARFALRKPEVMTGSGDAAEARRVELRVQ
jgi:outer membrane protein OmpA-like peptidoglycan-associated protein